MEIDKFYENREIFITGGTGFLGKSLIEKLLRDCPGITKMYMLIRAKRGRTANDRLQDFKNDVIFERLRRERPNAFEKIIPIIGDCNEIGLGISSENLKRLENVSVIFHEAAYVKFDNDLRSSILMNTRGTHELVKISQTLKNLIAFVHCSTAYIYPAGKDIEERIYKIPNDWRKTIEIAEKYDVNTLEILKYKFTNHYPNSYSFSKNLSEQIISDYSDKLPMTIVRPAIVAHSYKEPEPGFLDNLNGPMGLLATIALGISQMTYCNPDLNLSLMPVDIITCLTIAGGCKLGMDTLKHKNQPFSLTIRNFAPGSAYKYNLQQGCKKTIQVANLNPLQNVLWAPACRMTTNLYWYLLWVLFVHIPMALFYDAVLVLLQKEPIIMKTTRKIVFTSKMVSKFSNKYFNIHNDGMWELLDYTKEHDEKRAFYFVDLKTIDLEMAFEGLVRGFKKYIFKEPLEATEATRLRHKVFKYLNEITKLIICFIIIKYLWNLLN